MKRKLLFVLVLLMVSVAVFAGGKKEADESSGAKVFPEDNITIIVPFSAGGGVDTNTRILVNVGSDLMGGKKFIVENRVGSSGIVGLTYAKDADPDGYTIGATSYSMVSKPVLRKDSTFETEDFMPIALMTLDATVLAVPANSKYNTLADFLADAKNNKLNINTSGFQSGPHIAAIKFSRAAGIPLNYVHTDGAAVQVQQLLGKHVDGGILTVGEASKLLANKSIKVLGVTSTDRSPILTEVPTFIEQGVNVTYQVFRGFSVPKGTPQEICDELEKIFKDIITSDEFDAQMKEAGNLVTYMGQKDFRELVKVETESLRAIKDELTAK